ncbi:terminase [Mycobacterium phage Daisy]|nr:terminase [Mycobacterium phage Daisy]
MTTTPFDVPENRRRKVGFRDDEKPIFEPTWDDDGMFSSAKAARIYEAARNWPADQKAAAIRYIEAAKNRAQIRKRYANAAELATAVDPEFVITPALRIISDAIEDVLRYPRCNLLVTMPPQEGKSTMCAVWTPIRALQLNPNRRIILATYGDSLADQHSTTARDLIMRYGTGVTDALTGLAVEDKLGLKINPKQAKVSSWRIDGAIGGMVAAGLGSAITGKSADLFIIDDPFKNMIEADSARHREKVNEWFASVASTRLSPEASMILIQTRWHPEDLSGTIIAGEKLLDAEDRTWRHINVPAVSEEGIPDALGRPEPGIPMISARGRTLREFNQTRKSVGERVWYALYQGSPRNPAGGLFMRAWFEPMAERSPERPLATIVAIDPADSGEGDETGIIGGMLDRDGTIVLTDDWSDQMTSDKWGRQAVLLALKLGAREIALEAYASATTYANVVKNAWKALHREAVEKHNSGAALSPVEQRALATNMPFVIHQWRGKGDDVGRSALLRQQCETRKCLVVEGRMQTFVDQACDWQAGQHQPDRVAAAVIAHDRLHQLGGGMMQLPAGPTRKPPPAPTWMKRTIKKKGLG